MARLKPKRLKRDKEIRVKVSDSEYKAVIDAAYSQGYTLSHYVRERLLKQLETNAA